MSAYIKDPHLFTVKAGSDLNPNEPLENRSGPGYQIPEERSRLDQFSQYQLPHIYYEAEALCSSIRRMEEHSRKERERNAMIHAQLAQERSRLQNELTELNRRFQDSFNQLERTKLDLSKSDTKEKTILVQVRAQFEQIRNLQKDLQQTKQAYLNAHATHSAELNQTRTQLQNDQSKLREFEMQLKLNKEKYEQIIHQWKEKHSLATKEIEDLQEQIKGQADREEALLNQLSEQKGRLEKSLEKSKTHELKLISELNDHKSRVTQTLDQLKATQHRMEKTFLELEESRNLTRTIEGQFKELQHKGEMGQLEFKRAQDELSRTQKELGAQKEQERLHFNNYNNLRNKVKSIIDELTSLKLNNHLLQKELSTAKTQLKEETQKNQILGAQIAADPAQLDCEPSLEGPNELNNEVHSLLIEQKQLLSDLFNEPI